MKRTALVTGGARGIGAEICRTLAAMDFDVWVNYHTSEQAARALAAEICGHAIRADVRDAEAVREMLCAVGSVDLLVNNAGISHYGLFQALDLQQFRDLFAVNVDGVFHCTQGVLPYMLREKRGCIINIASAWGISGASYEAVYAATKASVIGLTKSLARELGPSNIRVNCVAPGAIDTDMVRGLAAADIAALRAETPLGTVGHPRDVAYLVGFLASERAGFMTGQVISPNGGLVI